MENKLITIVIVWLAALGGLFLFSSKSSKEPDYANIVQPIVISSSTPTSVAVVKTGKLNLTTTTTTLPLTPPPTTTTTSTPQAPVTNTTASTSVPLPTSTSTPSTSTSAMSPSTASPSATPTVQQSQKININTAGNQELEKITGVGPVIAQRIIDYRNTNGPFQKIEDIKNVSGIGDIKFEKMKDEITI